MKKIVLLLVMVCFLLSSCATLLGGPITDCQRTKPAPGEPPRTVRGGALIADLAIFWPGVFVDFGTGAIYKPCPNLMYSDSTAVPKKIASKDVDFSGFKKNIIKTSPISYWLEPTVFYDRYLGKGVYGSIKLGYKLGKDNTQGDNEQGKGVMFEYYSGPLVGFGLRFPTQWDCVKYYDKKGNAEMKFIDVELIYKKMSVSKVNLSTAGIGGELRDYERLAGSTDGVTLKLLFVKQIWHKNLLLELFYGVGLKWRMNDSLYKIGYGSCDGSTGNITYTGYKDYDDFKQNYDPKYYQVKTVEDKVFPTIHLGINVGLGW